MCGIVGIVNLCDMQPIQMATLKRMMESIRHRGPDNAGIYRDGSVGLGSVRLNIIDLAGGGQPIGNENGTLWIVYNGEVFNYLELRSELEQRGHIFSTQTDTEVILHLYEDEGPACLQRLNGQFAFAIWDIQQQCLFLARDRVGIRPLFYTQQHNQFIFGSEMKAIFASKKMIARIDSNSLRETFVHWSPQSSHTIFENVVELPPAHYLMIKDGQIRLHRYWQLDLMPETPERTPEAYCEELENLLIDAARIRLRADVPVGAYLSGGLDSSLTTSLISNYTDNKLNTFSIAFGDSDYDEEPFQKEMAAYLGTEHRFLHCEYADICKALPDVIWHTETPLLRTSPVPMFLLSKLVRSHNFKVVMTGEGADEFLAGYDIFKEMKIRRFWAVDPESKYRPELLTQLYPNIRNLGVSTAFLTGFFRKDLEKTDSPFYSHLVRWNNTARTMRFFSQSNYSRKTAESFSPDIPLPQNFRKWPSLSQAQYLEIMTFLSPYLLSSQGDRMAMAHSVEGRYPFLDHRVMEFCNRLPPKMKMPVLNEKFLLKQLGSKYLPKSIWTRRKRPYRAPIHQSFFSPSPPEYVTEMLSSKVTADAGYFDATAVQMLSNKALHMSETGRRLSEVEDMALIGILSTHLIHQQFVQHKGVQVQNRLDFEDIKVIDRLEIAS